MNNFQKLFDQTCKKFAFKHDAKQILNDVVQSMFNFNASSLVIHECFGADARYFVDKNYVRAIIDESEPTEYSLAIFELIKAYADTVAENPPFTDVLGMVFENSKSYNKKLGQFFTPPSIADALAMIQSGLEGVDVEKESISIADPTGCGAGSLLLGVLRHCYKTGGAELVAKLELHANDIDANLCMYTVVQIMTACATFKLPLRKLIVTRANTITGYEDMLSGKANMYCFVAREEYLEKSDEDEEQKAA